MNLFRKPTSRCLGTGGKGISKPMLNLNRIFLQIFLAGALLLKQIIALLATYINEKKVKMASAAAVLADEYVLTHASGSVFGKVNRDGQRESFRFRPSKSPGVAHAHQAVRHVPGTDGRFDPAMICHACKNKGAGGRNVQSIRLVKNQLIPVCM